MDIFLTFMADLGRQRTLAHHHHRREDVMDDFDRRVVGASNADSQLELIAALRGIRVKNNISVTEVATKMKVDPAMIYRFEKGGTNYTATTLRKYAKAVGAFLIQDAKDARDLAAPRAYANRKTTHQQPVPWAKVSNVRSFEAHAESRHKEHPIPDAAAMSRDHLMFEQEFSV